MIHNLITAITLLAGIASAFAAYFWFRASQVPAPPPAQPGFAVWGSRTHPDAPNVSVDASLLVEYVQESGRLNKIAASCSAAAAFFACLAALLSACASSTY